MRQNYLALAAMLLFGAFSAAVYGLGKNPSQMAAELRQQQQREAARAAQLDARADALNNAVSTKNGQTALDKMADVNAKNGVDVVKGVGQAATKNVPGQASTATRVTARTLPALGNIYDSVGQVEDSKMKAELEKTRAAATKAKNNATTLDQVATAIEKKVASQKTPEIKAPETKAPEIKAPTTKAAHPRQPTRSSSGDTKGRESIGTGDRKEFHGNDRAAEKADRTG